MHIYSSPRNMSVNLGSVSTKHEQHLLPNRLYLQQIWHCAHSFFSRLYFLPSSSSISLLIFFFFFFFFFNFIHYRPQIGNIPQNYLPCLSHYIGAVELFLCPQANTRALHLLWMKFICFSVCVHVCDGTGAPLGSGRSVKTQRDQLQGRTSIPLGVVTSLLRVGVRVSCTRSE